MNIILPSFVFKKLILFKTLDNCQILKYTGVKHSPFTCEPHHYTVKAYWYVINKLHNINQLIKYFINKQRTNYY